MSAAGKEASREHLLQTAGPIFAEAGFRGTTVRRICEAAQVNVAAINYYFGDKQRLYIETVKYARTLIEQRWPLPDWPADMSAEARLESLVFIFVNRLLCREASGWQMKLMMREMVEPTQASEEMVQEAFRPFFNVLVAIIEELVPEKTPQPVLHRLGFTVIGQCLFYRAHERAVRLMIDEDERNTEFTPDRLAAHIFEVSLSAIRGTGRRGSAAGFQVPTSRHTLTEPKK